MLGLTTKFFLSKSLPNNSFAVDKTGKKNITAKFKCRITHTCQFQLSLPFCSRFKVKKLTYPGNIYLTNFR